MPHPVVGGLIGAGFKGLVALRLVVTELHLRRAHCLRSSGFNSEGKVLQVGFGPSLPMLGQISCRNGAIKAALEFGAVRIGKVEWGRLGGEWSQEAPIE
jgi:hypothetical protein